MPTYKPVARFWSDYHRLSPLQQAMFWRAVELFIVGCETGEFHPRLRVKAFKSEPGVMEMSWAPDGRALWRYGDPIPGKRGPHIIWLRVGTHEIFKDR